MFYGLDVKRLQAVYGSHDQALIPEVRASQAAELENNDGFFEDAIAEGQCPNSETALREIVAGSFGDYEYAKPMYGYVLKILCEHLGELMSGDVYSVADHPYKSQLANSGPPIPIPYDEADFPTIGFLSAEDIPAEIKRLDAAPPRARRYLMLWSLPWLGKIFALFSLFRGKLYAQYMSNEDAVEDMAAYREVLVDAQSRSLGLVSFRH